jgi:anti-sigma regulatory factor (Ser/Thr protein kinase)
VGVACQIEFTSDPLLLSAIRAAVERFALQSGFDEEQSRMVTLAVDEAVSNVIRHAYNDRGGAPIALHLLRNDAQVEIVLLDEGREADLRRMKIPSPQELRPGGRGIHFIRKIMDAVEYQRLPGQNRLRLVKYRPARGTGS